MTIKKQAFTRGIILKADDVSFEGISGELKVGLTSQKIETYLNGAVREVITADQAQTLTNKTIDADNNTISDLEVDNLKSGVLNTSASLSGASDTQVPSALAAKDYADSVGSTAQTNLTNHLNDATDAHDASAISSVPSGNLAATDVQAALDELQGDADTASAHIAASTNVHGLSGGAAVVGTTSSQTLTNKILTGADIRTPVRSDVKQDTLANLVTYALTAANGQIVYATDEKAMYQVVDTELVGIGGAGIVKLTAGETISALELVYISTGTGNDSGRTAGRIYKVDASNDDRVEVLGFATKAITSGSIGEVQVSGNLKGFTGLTPGKVYYASSSVPGSITLTPPSSNSQWVVAVCLASAATEIVINPVSSASAIYVVDGDTSFTIANNQASAASVTGLLLDGVSTRGFILDYSIYRQTDTALSALAQVGQLRAVYNSQSSTWFMSDDYSGQNSGVTFTIQPSGQIQYTSSNIAGANYVGTMKYAIRKSFGV